MLRDITIGRYIERNSVIHRADPRTKILSAIILSAAVLMCRSLMSLILAFLFTFLSVKASRIPLKYILKGLKPFRLFLLFIFFVNIFTVDGYTVLSFGPIHISDTGINNAVLMTSKLALFAAVASMLTLTTSPIAITDGFARLIKPLKKLYIPTDSVAMIISVMLRLIPNIADEYERISRAQKARTSGLADKGIITKIRSVSDCMIPLFVNIFRHTDELAMAMDARCYGQNERNPRKKLQFTKLDCLPVTALMLFCVFFAIIEILH